MLYIIKDIFSAIIKLRFIYQTNVKIYSMFFAKNWYKCLEQKYLKNSSSGIF